jgi:hypothetical protein
VRFAIGLLDWLFGEKTTLEVLTPEGTIRKRTVTMKWIEQMKTVGKITDVDRQKVRVHVLDPLRGQYVMEWVVGEDIPEEKYDDLVDTKTRALYAATYYAAGEPKTTVLRKDLWDQAKEQFDAGDL